MVKHWARATRTPAGPPTRPSPEGRQVRRRRGTSSRRVCGRSRRWPRQWPREQCHRRCCSTAGVRGWARSRSTRERCWWRPGSGRWRRHRCAARRQCIGHKKARGGLVVRPGGRPRGGVHRAQGRGSSALGLSSGALARARGVPLSPPGTAPMAPIDPGGSIGRAGALAMVPQRQAHELSLWWRTGWRRSSRTGNPIPGSRRSARRRGGGSCRVRLLSAYEQAMGPKARNGGYLFMYTLRGCPRDG